MIIGILNLKGGAGKTMTAVCLGFAAHRAGLNVVVHDGDPQGSATIWALESEYKEVPLPFEVKAANIASVQGLARKLAKKDDGALHIFDCPPNGDFIDAVAEVADLCIVPGNPDPANTVKTFQTAECLRDAGINYALLITNSVKGRLTLKELRGEIERRELSFFDTEIRHHETLARSYKDRAYLLYEYGDLFNELSEVLSMGATYDEGKFLEEWQAEIKNRVAALDRKEDALLFEQLKSYAGEISDGILDKKGEER